MKNRKKKVVAAVVIAVCVIAGLAIAVHKPSEVVEETQPVETTAVEITVAPIKITPKKSTTVNSAEENLNEPLDEPTDETETADAKQSREIMQNFTEATKPEPPAPPQIPSEQATNPAAPPTYAPAQMTVTEATTAPKNVTPQKSGEQNGKAYIPGFGWVKTTDSHSEFAYDMKENGNKIGTFG